MAHKWAGMSRFGLITTWIGKIAMCHKWHRRRDLVHFLAHCLYFVTARFAIDILSLQHSVERSAWDVGQSCGS